MNLEELKISADFNQNLLIDRVEDLVRSEYDIDIDKLKGDVKKEYLKQVDEKFIKLMGKYIQDFRSINRENPNTERTIKNFLQSVGDIINENDVKEI